MRTDRLQSHSLFLNLLIALVTASLLTLTGCAANPPALSEKIGEAHGEAAWDRKQAVECDITVTFGGNTAIDGRMLYDIHSGKVRIDLADGSAMVFDGQKAWTTDSAQVARARFHLLTWPYFLAAPFKVDDPGATLRYEGWYRYSDYRTKLAMLTFAPGVGDTPDDWYLLYLEPDSHTLTAMAYIVTYGTPAAEANEDPHAIAYHDYRLIDGVLISHEWTFHNWSRENGLSADKLGAATISNVRFTSPDAAAFEAPEGAHESPLP